jgi:hypothetical protein
LDAEATDKAILIPRIDITNLATIAPVTGGSTESLLAYNTNLTTGKGYYYWDGSVWSKLLDDSGDAWLLEGNAGTTAGTNFIGTTDAVDFQVKTNSILMTTFENAGGRVKFENQISLGGTTTDATKFIALDFTATGASHTGADFKFADAAQNASLTGVKNEISGTSFVNSITGIYNDLEYGGAGFVPIMYGTRNELNVSAGIGAIVYGNYTDINNSSEIQQGYGNYTRFISSGDFTNMYANYSEISMSGDGGSILSLYYGKYASSTGTSIAELSMRKSEFHQTAGGVRDITELYGTYDDFHDLGMTSNIGAFYGNRIISLQNRIINTCLKVIQITEKLMD